MNSQQLEFSPQRPYDNQGGRSRSRTGKHFHRTSLLIKAFNHKFRLDLELNSQLLSPNIQQKHYMSNGYAMEGGRHDIEHCYYHGTVKDYPGASAAFHTCNGVSGVIHVGNETFVIHPFFGGDLSKHPHVIFEARTKANKGCANTGALERRMSGVRRQKHISGYRSESADVEEEHANGAGRYKRDVREATKYIETAIVVDKAMFEKRNGSTRAEVVHDAIQVANIADLYFRTLNTRVSVVYVETWGGANQAQIDGNKDIGKAISNFNDYTTRNLFKVDKDTTQLLTGETFAGGEAGVAVPDTVCTPKAVGISVDINVYEPHLLAGTMAHMIGHNVGMSHDDGREECVCRDWHGCIMAQSIVGLENVQPYKFSECSKNDYIDMLRMSHGGCMMNKPNELEIERRNCGNKIVEDDEECDCGTNEECENDPCCDSITCKLKTEAECASGMCCDNCKLRERGVICRDARNDCDIPEHCTGDSGECPKDVYKKNGNKCGEVKSALGEVIAEGYCFNGECPTLDGQCEKIWGYGGMSADEQCFDQFNTKGSINGHCGKDNNGDYKKCELENVKCGSLQCKDGDRHPNIAGLDQMSSKTVISIKGVEYECKTTSGPAVSREFTEHGLVHDGTPCGKSLVCVNQTCVSLFPYIDQTKCPTSANNIECNGEGVCTNMNRCFCNMGFGGPDCSIVIPVTTSAPTDAPPAINSEISYEKKETPYENYHGSNTMFLVGVLMSVVGFVFVTFTLMALCYRSVVVHRNFTLCLRKTTRTKYDPPYIKKPIIKGAGNSNHVSVEEVSLDGSNKLITYGNTFSRDHKMQSIRRSNIEEDNTHSEKGILKNVRAYSGIVLNEHNKDKWAEDHRQNGDNLELIQQQGETQDGEELKGPGFERTAKALEGYHEDIIFMIQNAQSSSQRGTGAGNTPSGSGSISEELLRKALQECSAAALNYGEYKRGGSKSSSKENICDSMQPHSIMVENGPSTSMMHSQHRSHSMHQQSHMQQSQQADDDVATSTGGQLRIRNIEDLIRQLEHHSTRHMSPSGSEDIRMSENEADRHYRLDSSACSESSQGSNQQLAQQQKTATIMSSYNSRCRPRSEDENRFVYGVTRYRHPTQNRHPMHQPHSPHSTHSFGHHSHHGHAHGHVSHGAHSSHHSSHTHLHQDEEGIYESADHHDRSMVDPRVNRETPDSESDDFIQAQPQIARWASEDVVSVVLEPDSTQSISIKMPHQTAPSVSLVTAQSAINTGNINDSSLQIQQHQHYQDAVDTITSTAIMSDSPMGSVVPIQVMTGNGINVGHRYYPSPPSTETETSSGSVQPIHLTQTTQQQQHLSNHRHVRIDQDSDDAQSMGTSGYPEYKH
ncbi:disintegrin and metalloproteinase domain-containing protein unc-71 [Contarinia nasturtii]|uniref:disintegrin and metalloproteinase domain-containing protein unc-71 n=1 Tax=Contarinia nasturtii TaxID=265458 RepID=UPI0012D39952|nr:disintegrin and metalloproteinase domain-containing protein unc-71 [Contarinia nasturtii]